MKCKCCDLLMSGHPGWFIHIDESGKQIKVEETMCSSCRGIVRDIDNHDDENHQLYNLTSDIASVVFSGGLTPVPKIPY